MKEMLSLVISTALHPGRSENDTIYSAGGRSARVVQSGRRRHKLLSHKTRAKQTPDRVRHVVGYLLL